MSTYRLTIYAYADADSESAARQCWIDGDYAGQTFWSADVVDGPDVEGDRVDRDRSLADDDSIGDTTASGDDVEYERGYADGYRAGLAASS